MRTVVFTLLALVLLPLAAASGENAQPYADLETRPIKGLSDEQITGLRTGLGMGLALAAELNGYPGPRHVIDLAENLQLTDAQYEEIQGLFDAMQEETVSIGEKLIEQEAQLEQQFAERSVTPASLDALTQAIGVTQGALRAAHLKYHLATFAALSPEQVERYNVLRGYSIGVARHHRHDAH